MCGVGKWIEKVAFRPRDQEILQCAGLWLVRGVNPKWNGSDDDDSEGFLRRATLLEDALPGDRDLGPPPE